MEFENSNITDGDWDVKVIIQRCGLKSHLDHCVGLVLVPSNINRFSMKMSKKVREYKSGDFIFAKVKGYPAWPARVQRLNGKKYFVYFYGTGETANLAPNMIFDYAENKDKFLTKTVKRRDFNDGVKQIEYDFANNVPLEQVIGTVAEAPVEANDTVNDSTTNETMDDTVADTTAADDTVADETVNTTQNDTAVEDSDETGALVIDEGKKGRKSTAKTPAKDTSKLKEPKTPRGKGKKDDAKEDDSEKKDDEIVSRSGRKIRPKRYIDEQTEENTTLPTPAPKKRRGTSPQQEEKKEVSKEKQKPEAKEPEKTMKHFNAVPQSELQEIKEPFKSDDAEKENILITYLPSGQYVGIKLFQSRPTSFKNEAARLQWDKQAATNAITLKHQLEKGQITSQSVISLLVTDLNLTDEEKATLDKERETEEKKLRLQFLKTEMKLIELDAKIKTCLCLEKADTDLCLKLLDELMELDVKPLMLLKHPSCLETVKRLRAYVGNTPSWDLTEDAAILFAKQAHRIRKQADGLYKALKELFTTPEGLSFWEYFSERVLHFKKVTSKLTSDELLEMVHEPIEMSQPTSHTMKAAIDAANEEELSQPDEEDPQKKKGTPAKGKKTSQNNGQKAPLKRQSSRKQQDEEKDSSNKESEPSINATEEKSSEVEESNEKQSSETEVNKDNNEATKEKNSKDNDNEDKDKEARSNEKEPSDNNKERKDNSKELKDKSKETKDNKTVKDNNRASKDNKDSKDSNKEVKDNNNKEVKGSSSNKEVKDNKGGKDSKEVEDKEAKSTNKEVKSSSHKEAKPTTNKETKDINKESKSTNKDAKDTNKDAKDTNKDTKGTNKEAKDTNKEVKGTNKDAKDTNKETKDTNKDAKGTNKDVKSTNKEVKDTNKEVKDTNKETKDSKESKSKEAKDNNKEKESQENSLKENEDKQPQEEMEVDKDTNEKAEKRPKDSEEKDKSEEPRVKRMRESKKTDAPPPRSPAKRKAKS